MELIKKKRKSIIPGLSLTLGFSVAYLSLIVLIPLSMLFIKTSTMPWHEFVKAVTSPRALAAYKLSFGASAISAFINAVFGLLTAWVLVKYDFWGKKLVSAMIDLPFALPTAVAGIALTALFAPQGWMGKWFYEIGIPTAFSPVGIVIALTFIGLPFVVRTVEPILEDIYREVEEVASSLGANRWQTFSRVIFSILLPSIITGSAMAFARAIGEYGSVVFISGNMPLKTEIVPLLIITKLEQYDYQGATAIALVMLILSFGILLALNLLQKWRLKT